MRTPRSTGAATLSIDPEGRVATIRVSRGTQQQTLPPDLLAELDRILHLAATAQVVILRTGDKTTGVDGDQAVPRPALVDEWCEWTPLGHRVFDHITQLPRPTIAVVNGLAIGFGADLALACDHRVATDNARVGPCAVGLGTIPGCAGTQRLTQLIGSQRANEMLRRTPRLDAKKALEWGLLTNVTSTEGLEHFLDHLVHSVLGPDNLMNAPRHFHGRSSQ